MPTDRLLAKSTNTYPTYVTPEAPRLSLKECQSVTGLTTTRSDVPFARAPKPGTARTVVGVPDLSLARAASGRSLKAE